MYIFPCNIVKLSFSIEKGRLQLYESICFIFIILLKSLASAVFFNYSATGKSLEDARTDCRNRNLGLLEITSEATQREFEKFVPQFDSLKTSWLWLNVYVENNKFFWKDGDSFVPITYQNWALGYPDLQTTIRSVVISCSFESASNATSCLWRSSTADSSLLRYVCYGFRTDEVGNAGDSSSNSGNGSGGKPSPPSSVGLAVGISLGVLVLAAIIIAVVVIFQKKTKSRMPSIRRLPSVQQQQYDEGYVNNNNNNNDVLYSTTISNYNNNNRNYISTLSNAGINFDDINREPDYDNNRNVIYNYGINHEETNKNNNISMNNVKSNSEYEEINAIAINDNINNNDNINDNINTNNHNNVNRAYTQVTIHDANHVYDRLSNVQNNNNNINNNNNNDNSYYNMNKDNIDYYNVKNNNNNIAKVNDSQVEYSRVIKELQKNN
ncbi:hypothetical protein HELRODRAFT_182567 [Helobdella robusta]|uniref:C-type lectin domain-containing protein n=1 Tax=Helobdella robusta TaxID=6412 RepID=T1FID1_HELRO|nr:hypothetical protein HELRODRAFT_182567 [Helobdella robusta]ESN90859.1 hypothetical protein HELRODRAFT_182567 [Helobdella robusta]